MGWLFAVALGLQEKKRSAVVAALWPISAGHATAVALTILLLRAVQPFLSLPILKLAVATTLFATGVYRLFRASHPRGAGMRVGGGDLFIWSFLMASGHGAGLMLMPVLLSLPMRGMAPTMMLHMMKAHSMATPVPSVSTSMSLHVIVLAILVHTLSLLTVAGGLALVVFETYERVGLGPLRHAWLNFDLVWAIALLLAGCATLLL